MLPSLRRLVAACCAAVCIAVVLQVSHGQETPVAPRGSDIFDSACAHCHGPSGQGGQLGPSILQRVAETDDEALAAFLRAGVPQRGMPPAPVAGAEMSVLVGYLRFLGAAAGDSPGGDTGVAGAASGSVAAFRPVTEAMRQAPDAADWLDVGRLRDGRRYSPLEQLNAENVRGLQLAWSRGLPDGNGEASVLVYSGVMYIAMPDASVAALDAATGDVIWQTTLDERDGISRSSAGRLSIVGDALYLATENAAPVAVDARTGALRPDRPADAEPVRPQTSTTSGEGLATGGGLLFRGDAERRYRAVDADSGDVAWQTVLGGPIGTDLSYAADGRQHVAVIVGAAPPDGSTPGAIYVFALPGAGEQDRQ